ncbi:MAG: Hsp20/alpha crystallin family protein [Deltaproteobacteria bacterium]
MFQWGFRRDPMWAEFNRIQRNINDLARQMGTSVRSSIHPFWRTSRIFPLLNVVRTDVSYIVTAELAGISAEDLEIKVEGDTVVIKGERKAEDFGAEVSYHRRERTSGTFHRSLTLPTRVEADEVKANYVDGILTITLPIEKAAQPKQISVTAE